MGKLASQVQSVQGQEEDQFSVALCNNTDPFTTVWRRC